MRWLLLVVFLFGCAAEVEMPIRSSPGGIVPASMNDRQWSEYVGNQRVQYYREGQTAYDTGTGFWLGLDDGTPKFSIGNSAGNKLTWNGTTLAIVGNVTATTGTIGGWTLSATALTAGSGATTVGLDSGGTNPALYAGSATPGSAPFRVTQAGALTATSGAIGGWTLGVTSLLSGSGATTVGLDSGGTNPAIYAGSATPASAPFRVTQAGALFASSATVSGDISGGKQAYKSATTSRDNTTTYADDPDLSIALSASAIYAIDFLLLPYNEASTPNMKMQFAYSGTGNFRRIFGVSNEPAVPTFAFFGPLTSGEVFNQLPSYAPFDQGALWGTVTYETTTAGNFTVQWAQASSSANDCRLTAGSYMKATRLI